MGILRAVFWSSLVGAAAFAIIVFLRHGAHGFADGATGAVEHFVDQLRSLTGGRN